jgi:hypothetical protein
MQNAGKSDKNVAKKKTTQKALRAERALHSVPHPGLTFPYKHQVFIAKAKRGELWALNNLSIAARAAITPLFEMWPPATPRSPKSEEGKPRPKPKTPKTLVTHATDLLQIIRDEWNKLPFFLDTRYVPLGGIPSPSSAKTIFDVARTMQLMAIPTTSIKFAPAYQFEIRDVIAKDDRGVLIRLFITDFINPNLLGSYLTALLGVLQVTANQADILIDLEFRQEQIEVQQLGASAISVLPFLKDWRTVTLAAGCFPQSISKLSYGTWSQVLRSDWLGWLQVNSLQAANASRRAAYGDYGIRCGGIPADIPNRPDPNIRYSDKQKILVRKEGKTDGKMKTICSSLVARSEFSGMKFSRGDAEIAARAAMPGSPNNGQAEQWIQWCTNHHLELTASQIQNLP